MKPSIRHAWPLALLFALLCCAEAAAQTGSLTGRVTDAESGKPLSGATIRLSRSDGGGARQIGAISGPDGNYTVKSVTAGTYKVMITFLSYSAFEQQAEVKPGEATLLNAALAQKTISNDEVVISASRRPEKATSAPASVSVVGARQIQERPSLTSIEHIKGVPGVDIVQSGLVQSNTVLRGFNNAFSGALTVLTDNRLAGVPSLRANAYNFIPLVNDDIQQLEIIRGPASALYGPNAANGVFHTITRSPFSSAGTSISLTAGERSIFQGTLRHAGTIGDNFGYKISGQYMRGEDWGYVDTAESSARAAFLADTNNRGANPDTLKIGLRDSTIERIGGELRLDYMPVDDLTLIFAAGLNQAINNTDLTGVGAAQAQNWRYSYYQLRTLYKDLFFQAFLNQSDAGETYLLRTGAPIVDRSSLFVTQIQHSYQLADIERLTYGADLQFTNPVTDSTVNGRNEGDDNFTEFGIYLQSETKLIPEMLDLTVAGRFDKHSRLDDPIISPRAALVFTPLKDHALRFTYNQAYSAPTTNEMFLDIIAANTQLFNVRAAGVPQSGYSFSFDASGNPIMHSFLADPSKGLSSTDVGAIWEGLKQVLIANFPDTATQSVIRQIPAPPPGVVKTELRGVNPANGTFISFNPSSIANRGPTKPTLTSTIELGYNGVLADRVAISLDLYRSHYTDFVGPLQVITPTVFLERQSLEGYLTQVFIGGGLPEGQAKLLAASFAPQVSGILGDTLLRGVPVGTVTPNEVNDPTAVYLTYRNYGNITLYGYDLGLQVGVAEGLALNGSVSYVDKNFFRNLDGVADLSLNAPKFKFSVGAEYRSAQLGFSIRSLFRHVDGFQVNSGVYLGSVPGYSVVDLNIDYELPWVEGLKATLTAQNLLTFVEGSDGGPFSQRHSEFVGAAPIGRLVLGRLSYSFR